MIQNGPTPDHDFTILYNSTLRDKNLSWAALGLLSYLLSHKPNWKVSATHLAKERNLKRDGIYKLLNELREAGYAEMRQKRQGHGRMGDVDWIIHGLPLPASPDTANPEAVDSPDTASPDTANPEADDVEEKQELAPLTVNPEADVSPLPASPDTANPDHKKNYKERRTMEEKEKDLALLEGAAAPAVIDDALLLATPTNSSKKTSRGTRLPADWVLPPDWAKWASSERPELNVKKVAERFRDHWIAKPGKDGLKLDWFATWRNWVRNERIINGSNRGATQFAGSPLLGGGI